MTSESSVGARENEGTNVLDLDAAFFFVRSAFGPERKTDEECWAIVEAAAAEAEQ